MAVAIAGLGIERRLSVIIINMINDHDADTTNDEKYLTTTTATATSIGKNEVNMLNKASTICRKSVDGHEDCN